MTQRIKQLVASIINIKAETEKQDRAQDEQEAGTTTVMTSFGCWSDQ